MMFQHHGPRTYGPHITNRIPDRPHNTSVNYIPDYPDANTTYNRHRQSSTASSTSRQSLGDPFIGSPHGGVALPYGTYGSTKNNIFTSIDDSGTYAANYGSNSSTRVVPPYAMLPSQIPSPVPTPTPSGVPSASTEQRRTARSLANLIKSGAVGDVESTPVRAIPTRGGPSHNGGRRPGSPQADAWALQRLPMPPAQAICLSGPVADPPFFEAAKAGIRPSLEDALQHVPFIEPGRQAPIVKTGVVKLTNVSCCVSFLWDYPY